MVKAVEYSNGAPRVSLHIAVYNTAKYVEAAVRSVLAQTYRNFELVLWDDGSSDGSLEILEKLARTDSRIRVVKGEHAGVAAAHEGAAALGRGEYLGWIDSDDLLAPAALAETVAALDANPDAGFVYTDYLEMDESGAKERLGHRCQIPYSSQRLLVDFMTFHFRLLRRSVFEAAGGIDAANQSGAEDYDLCLRMSEKAEVIHLAKPLYRYRLRRESFSNKHRLTQINASFEAVRRALVRRGMENEYDLSLELLAKVILKRKDGKGIDSRGKLNVAAGRRTTLVKTQMPTNRHKSPQIEKAGT